MCEPAPNTPFLKNPDFSRIPNFFGFKLTYLRVSENQSYVAIFFSILEQKHDGVWTRVTEANFVLVARDPTNTKGAVLNRLSTETSEEKALFERGQRNTIARKECAKDTLFKNPPTEHEKMLIHDFFIQTVDHSALSFKARVKPENRYVFNLFYMNYL